MELYPGPINTGVVVLNEPCAGDLSIHPGAIVAGLGIVGELTPGSLTSTLAHALTLYGADCVGRDAAPPAARAATSPAATVAAPVTAILVGFGRRRAVAVRQRAGAAARRAAGEPAPARRDRRRAAAGDGSSRWSRRSIASTSSSCTRIAPSKRCTRCAALTQAPEFDGFLVEELLVTGDGGPAAGAVRAGQRLVAAHAGEEQGGRRRSSSRRSRRRRARRSRLRPTQRGLVDGFVQQAIETTANDPKLGHTLFELLVPNDFKPYAPDRRKLALMLNPEAAALPWELMHDGFDRSRGTALGRRAA